MTVATLLNANDPAFSFDHYNDHVAMIGTEARRASSLNFSGIPYWIDPPYGDTAVPAGNENSLHAQAHADFISLFPSPNGATSIDCLNDIALNSETSAWWQFSNFQLHFIANQLF